MRKTIKLNRDIYEKMKQIYYEKKNHIYDWMGNLITEENYRTYHHIEKAEDLRKNNESDEPTLENGAFLGKKSHEQLHRIEHIDYELYIEWNKLFREINDKKEVISDDLWKRVFELHDITEKIDKRNSKRLKL